MRAKPLEAWPRPRGRNGRLLAAAARSLLACPPGRHLNSSAAADATAALALHWRQLRELGYRPRSTTPEAAARSVARGFLTYESPLWPRPAHCARRRQRRAPRSIIDEPPGTCEPNGTVCDKYRVSRAYRFVWHHVWKGGTTSLSPYLSCNFDAMPAAGLLRRLPAPLPGYLHVGTAREPLHRFVSAFQEVYSRLRLHPSGARCVHRNVPWLRQAMRSAGDASGSGCAAADAPPPDEELRALLRHFVADLECSVRYPTVEHLYTQSLFLGGNTTVPQPVDMLLRLETLPADVAALKAAVGYATADACPLKSERVAAQKPRAVPASPRVRQMLEAEPGLLQAVCNVYVQDFVCLGYPLPPACQLVPPRASTGAASAEE